MKQIIKLAVIFILTISIAAMVLLLPVVKCLTITNRKDTTEKVYSRQALGGFIISYTHSVNKGRVHDYYSCNNNQLTVYKTDFVSYGAGIPECYETEGAKFFTKNDTYQIDCLNRTVKQLLMAVGVIANHSITINNREFFLTNYFAPQTSLIFKVKRVSVLSYLSTRKM